MHERSYWERLRGTSPLFQNRIFQEDNAQAEVNYTQEKFPGLNDTANIPKGLKDNLIMRVIRSKNSPLETLKIFGSPALKADYLKPVLIKAAERGKITEEQAKTYEASIHQGGGHWFFVDAGVGFTTHWFVEKLAIPPVKEAISTVVPNEFAAWVLTGYFGVANFLAIGWFGPRALVEYFAYKDRLFQKPIALEQLKEQLKEAKKVYTKAVFYNALPVLSALTTPYLNSYRYEFCRPMLDYYSEQIDDTAKKVKTLYRNVVL